MRHTSLISLGALVILAGAIGSGCDAGGSDPVGDGGGSESGGGDDTGGDSGGDDTGSGGGDDDTGSGGGDDDTGYTPGPCAGQCGGDGGGCFCDDECAEWGDCCEGACDDCPGLAWCSGGGGTGDDTGGDDTGSDTPDDTPDDQTGDDDCSSGDKTCDGDDLMTCSGGELELLRDLRQRVPRRDLRDR